MKKSRKQRRLIKEERRRRKELGRKTQAAAKTPPAVGRSGSGMKIVSLRRFEPNKVGCEIVIPACGRPQDGSGGFLLFTAGATANLMRAFGFGKTTEKNRVEQLGVILGQVYETPGGVVGIAEEIVMLETAGLSAYVENTHSDWFEMHEQVERLNEQRKRKLVIIGWVHSHPNDLPVFFSGTDRATQSQYFSEYWQFGAVVNPQKKIWRVFRGGDSLPCDGLMLCPKCYEKEVK